jgi:hypothetical protein
MKVEKEVPLSLPTLRQRITVLCEQEPKRFTNNALHSNEERISFTVHGQESDLFFAIVTSVGAEDDVTKISIESSQVVTHWPVWMAVYVTATIFYVLFVKPSNFSLWLPIIILWLLAIKPVLLPLIRANGDEKKLVEDVDKFLDELARA